MRTFAKLICLLLSAVLVGSVCLVLVYAIPESLVIGHARTAKTVFENQYTWERMIPGAEATRLDNYTAAIMLSEACYESNENP